MLNGFRSWPSSSFRNVSSRGKSVESLWRCGGSVECMHRSQRDAVVRVAARIYPVDDGNEIAVIAPGGQAEPMINEYNYPRPWLRIVGVTLMA